MIILVALLAQADVDCASCHKPHAQEHGVSIHKQKGISCNGCHGTDTFNFARTQMPHLFTKSFDPGRNVPGLCVKCHEPEVEKFKTSKHWEFEVREGRRKLKNCLVCHSHHGTEEAVFGKISARCISCHQDAPSKVREIGAVLDNDRARYEALVAKTKGYRVPPGVDARSELDAVEEVRLLMAAQRREQHAADPKDLRNRHEQLSTRQREALEGLAKKESIVAQRPLWLAGFVFVLAVFTGCLAQLLRRKYD